MQAKRILRYLNASDFIAGTLAISAMGILRDASGNLIKMLCDLAWQVGQLSTFSCHPFAI